MINNKQSKQKPIRKSPKVDKYFGVFNEYTQQVATLMQLEPAAMQQDENLRDQLAQSAGQLTAMLRWERRHAEAIKLQEQLIPFLPDDAAALRVVASTLKIEHGNEQDGFKELQATAEQDANNIWGWIALGSSYLWVGRYAEAETSLLKAVNLEAVESSDLAAAYQYLFKLYSVQKRVEDATQAWEQSVRLNPALAATVSDLLRMHIYWYYYETAERFLVRETSELRHNFYQNLINVKRSPVFPRRSWEWVMEYDPETLEEGHDEFAEACVRFVKPGRALTAIEPLIDAGAISKRRLVLAGLAWAQERMIDRAKWALDLALRAGELESPRGTRRSVGGLRVLDAESRILYGEIIVDPDIRKEVDRYFMPVVNHD
jgi:tetratricopeptide (TPR) repeat protein